MFRPKIIETLKQFSNEQLLRDITAGVIVGIIAIPLSIALAISSGVSPVQGLTTAVIAGLIVSLLGGSRVQIGGPTGAFVIIIYGIIREYGYPGLAVASIMAGIFLMLLGILRLGTLIRYVPCTITVGFTAGIAIVIFSQQLNDFLGLGISDLPSEFIDKIKVIIMNISKTDIYSLATGAGSLILIIVWERISKKIPGSLVSIIIATLAVKIFSLPVETIGSRFPDLGSGFPLPSLPSFDFSQIGSLIQPALTIGILAGIESLMSAVVADKLVVDKHDSNTELIAQGAANIISPLFGGIPATGAIARTAANIKNGGRTPVSGIVHSLTILLVMLILMPLARMIPMASLAAILMVVAYNMSGWREFSAILRMGKSDILVLCVTFILTVILDLVIAIEIGFLLAIVMFFISMTRRSNIVLNESLSTEHLSVVSINGPFFFAASDAFVEFIKNNCTEAKTIILSLENSYHMDASGINALIEIKDFCDISRKKLLLTDTKEDIDKLLQKSQIISLLGRGNIFPSLKEAIDHVSVAFPVTSGSES
ncbi:MAG: SulP family inorganic anion transporter [Eubacteriales bacterium]|nr:SulP family inorganic anion transporter [Eubacteriales bacterium]MDD4716877.1 SulP family inorganic anion transporter [Eubacteriales bacterium]